MRDERTRDHALVRALGKLGHEMTLVPLYLPMVTDDEKEDTKVPLVVSRVT